MWFMGLAWLMGLIKPISHVAYRQFLWLIAAIQLLHIIN